MLEGLYVVYYLLMTYGVSVTSMVTPEWSFWLSVINKTINSLQQTILLCSIFHESCMCFMYKYINIM